MNLVLGTILVACGFASGLACTLYLMRWLLPDPDEEEWEEVGAWHP